MKGKIRKVLVCAGILIVCIIVNIIILHKLPIPEGSYMKFGIVMLILEILGMYYLVTQDMQYKAELITITPDIKTPATAGQGQYGTAKWLQEKNFEKAYDVCVIDANTREIPQGGLVLGKKELKGQREQVYYIGDDTHTITIGSTRSGKTRHEVLETIGFCGLAGESMVITDIKGELYDYTASYLRELQYEVAVLDYDEQELSEDYNLLQPVIDYIDTDNISKAIDACWDIVSQMVGEPKGERIWNDGECCAIAGAIMSVCYDNRKPEFHKYRNCTNVYYFLVEMCTPIGDFIPLNFYRASLPDTHPCKGIFAVAGIAPARTRSSFYTAALMTLRLFTNPNLYNITKATGFNPDDLGTKKMAVFIILPEDRTTYHPIATLFISQMYSQLSKLAKKNGGRLSNRVEFICDEFGNFTKIPDFMQYLTVAGGKGIRFHLFLQDYAQLDAKYEKDVAKTIRNNCETKVYLKSADEDTREIISKELGDYTTKGYNVSYSRHKSGESSASSNLVGRRLLTSEEVGKIKRPYSLIMRTEENPAIMYAPDLSKWSFNERFGMGDVAHNQKLRIQRHQERPVRQLGEIELWGIWTKYQEIARITLRKKQAQNEGNTEGDDD